MKQPTTYNVFSGNIPELIAKLEELNYTAMLNFSGQPSCKVAHDRILNGCPAMFEKYQKYTENTLRKGYDSKSYSIDTEGLFFDVPAFLTGEQEYWINEVEEQQAGKVKDLHINIAASCGVTQGTIFDKLIKVAEMIDNAEAAGCRLLIKAVLYSKHPYDTESPKLTFDVTVKNEGEPVNMQQLVYLFANPILLRYAFLSLQVNCPYTYNPTTDIEAEIAATKQTEFVYIPSIYWDKKNRINDYLNFEPIKAYHLDL